MSSKKSEKERKDKIFKELSAVINNDQSARYFCDVLEAVFLHGLKNPKSLWPCLALLIPENIKLVLSALRNSQSDIWKCRVRVELNSGLLIKKPYKIKGFKHDVHDAFILHRQRVRSETLLERS
ncbi:uncharacterized protein [Dysidea avara]|uniref:uncharacterized protein isoform X2 n=1 Tax=Dysidea avara TaxID=196820 RepID=UPI003334659A